jgi:succinyl-CoA synthetase beta subunit
MRLQEYQGKELFRRVGIPVAEGKIALSASEAEEIARELGGPVVVKAQVLVGGRGKAGGIKLARTPEEARAHAENILQMTIKGERVRKVLVTRAVQIEQEFYLSITIDRAAKKPVVIFSAEGGMEIEELAQGPRRTRS